MEHERRPVASVASFFIGAFAVTWGLQLPAVLAKAGFLPGPLEAYMPFAMLGVLGPLAAATWLSAREGGKPAVRALYARLLRYRVHVGWYAAALLVPGLALTGVLLVFRTLGWQGDVIFLPSIGGVIGAIVISLGEEVGWRGYALPHLQRRYGPFGASGLIAIAWTLWHIPMFIGAGVSLALLPVMFLLFSGGSLMYTWIYNGTGGSLLLVVLAHIGAHLNNSHAALPDSVLPAVVHAVIYAAIGYAVLAPAVLRSRGARRRSPVESAS
jgi:uncharacterized protein